MKFPNKINQVFTIMIVMMAVTLCKPPELKVTSIELCENFNSEGVCREKLEKEHTYNIQVNRTKKFEGRSISQQLNTSLR